MDLPIWLQTLAATVAGAIGGGIAATNKTNSKIKDFELRINSLEEKNNSINSKLDSISEALREIHKDQREVKDSFYKYTFVLEKLYQQEIHKN